jgi:hypothetical protein
LNQTKLEIDTKQGVKGKGTVSFAATHDGSVWNEEMNRDTQLEFPRHGGGLPSSLQSHKGLAKSRPSTSDSPSSSETVSGNFVPIKETKHELSPEDTTSGIAKPKGGQKRALVITANEDNLPTFNGGVSNTTIGSLDADSSGILADIEIIQEDLPSDLREEAAAMLDPGQRKIEALFGKLGLPLSPDRIPRGDISVTGRVKYHTAS